MTLSVMSENPINTPNQGYELLVNNPWFKWGQGECPEDKIVTYLSVLNPRGTVDVIEKVKTKNFIGAVTRFHEMEEIILMQNVMGKDKFELALKNPDLGADILHSYFENDKGRYSSYYRYSHERALYAELILIQQTFKELKGKEFSLPSILSTHPRWAGERLPFELQPVEKNATPHLYLKSIVNTQMTDLSDCLDVGRGDFLGEVKDVASCWLEVGGHFSDEYMQMIGITPDTMSI